MQILVGKVVFLSGSGGTLSTTRLSEVCPTAVLELLSAAGAQPAERDAAGPARGVSCSAGWGPA